MKHSRLPIVGATGRRPPPDVNRSGGMYAWALGSHLPARSCQARSHPSSRDCLRRPAGHLPDLLFSGRAGLPREPCPVLNVAVFRWRPWDLSGA